MDLTALSKKIIELRIATRRACMCEDGDKSLISLKTKMLFVIADGGVNPPEIMARLKVLKPNLAAMSKELEGEGLITRAKTLTDRRSITYALTPEGEKYLEIRINRIADMLKGVYGEQAAYDDAGRKIEEVLDFLSFLQA